MKSLPGLLKNLEEKSEVDSVFLTGSYGTTTANENSDIDLIVVLTVNQTGIRSVYEKIDGVLADIFFFDKHELEKLLYQREINCNSFDGMLISWVKKSDIKFDKSGILTKLKIKAHEIKLIVTEHERNSVLNKISYNYFQNQRYFNSNDSIYHEALEIRLMYSVTELLVGFLALRNEPWRGEKDAIKFIKKTMLKFYNLFERYTKSKSLEKKMDIYTKMIVEVLPQGFHLFDYEVPVALPRGDNTSKEIKKQKQFWNNITGL